MDQKSYLLLQEVLSNPGIMMKQLEERMQLSRNKLEYLMRKTNQFLSDYNLPQIERKNKGLYCSADVAHNLPDILKEMDNVFLHEEERVSILLLMIITRQEELSLVNFIYELEVSKNTVLADLKKADHILKDYYLKLCYSRKIGYHIEGSELSKRQLMLELLHKQLSSPNVMKWINNLFKDEQIDLEMFRKKMEAIEKDLHLTFSDERIQELPYIMLFCSIRSLQNKSIEDEMREIAPYIAQKHEFSVVKKHLQLVLDSHDMVFITLQILGSNVVSSHVESQIDLELHKIIDKFVDRFEQLACITFDEREELARKLYQHIKPAIYRVKYGITSKNPLLQEIKEEYRDVYDLIKRCIDEIEELIDERLPEDEIGYITVLIMGWLCKNKKMPQHRYKAIVVCQNGISVSHLLLENLRTMFPSFDFLGHYSVRNFYQIEEKYEIVFSTVPLETDQKLFMIKSFLTEENKAVLQRNVNRSINGYSTETNIVSELLSVISPFVDIRDKRGLNRALTNYFYSSEKSLDVSCIGDKLLPDLLTPDRIKFAKSALNFADAVWQTGQPLLEEGVISRDYLDTIVSQYDPEEPYIVITPFVALPHAKPEDGVNELSMSMLLLEHEVEVAENVPVRAMIMLAPSDYETHLPALMQLNNIIFEQENVQELLSLKDSIDVFTFIKEKCKEIER